MITVRPSQERGRANHGWLDTRHTFSFANYYDPDHMGFRDLRVVNEDRVDGGAGFPTHPHRDMEIISYVVEGALEHKDSMGNSSVIRPGDVQRMTAGTGVTHSEFNHSKDEPVRFLQIWIQPSQPGLTPGYDQRHFSDDERRGRLRLVASPSGREGSVSVNQDMRFYSALLEPGQDVRHEAGVGRHIWLQLIEGSVTANDIRLRSGDGAAVSDASSLVIRAEESSHFLLFDLA
jgi:redox-sensitive bicupin YhaK (pirin superfamily)